MKVSAWSNGGSTFGVRVGPGNRDEYFDPEWTEILVAIDGVFHRFGLTKGFWKDCPEFRDRGAPLIRRWLERRHMVPWPKGSPPTMSLIPLGEGRFELVNAPPADG